MGRLFTFSAPGYASGVGSTAQGSTNACCLFAWSDGDQWYALRDDPRYKLPAGTRLIEATAATLDAERAAIWAWAQRASPAFQRIAFTEPRVVREESERLTVGKMPFADRLASVGYKQWSRLSRSSAHSLEELHRTVVAALEKVWRAWGWVPRGLMISFHDSRRTMGLAYHTPTDPRVATQRDISLNRRLLAEYDLPSIERTVLHELAHLLRFDEAWPNVRLGSKGHDERFCELLAQVDPIVASSPKECRYFTDDVDPALASAIEQDRLERAKKRQAKSGVVWDRLQGRLVVRRLKTTVNLVWESNAALPMFSPVKMKLRDADMVALLDHFPSDVWDLVRVEWDTRRLPPWAGHTLYSLAQGVVRMYPEQFKKTAQRMAVSAGGFAWRG